MKARAVAHPDYTNLAMISGIKDAVAASPVPVVFDHFGGAQAALGTQQPGFADLVELVRSGKAYVKISAAYRSSKNGPDLPMSRRSPRRLLRRTRTVSSGVPTGRIRTEPAAA